MPAEHLISAKFPGKCPTCGYRIDVDDWIFYDPAFKQARHKKCPKPSYNGSEQKKILDMWVERLKGKDGINE